MQLLTVLGGKESGRRVAGCRFAMDKLDSMLIGSTAVSVKHTTRCKKTGTARRGPNLGQNCG
eukprot:2689344-Rhodomonas_salina.2